MRGRRAWGAPVESEEWIVERRDALLAPVFSNQWGVGPATHFVSFVPFVVNPS